MTIRPRLFGMITTARSTEYTVEALRTFFIHTNFSPEDRFILIDNDGGWSQQIRSINPEVSVLVNSLPLGFASNSNNLARQAMADKRDLFVLNNDLIFTSDWSTPLDNSGLSISCPLSNREVQYVMAIQVAKTGASSKLFNCPMEMNLEQYRGSEFAVQALAETHRLNSPQGFLPVLVMPYFCVRIPLEVLEKIGLFDESFGRGGAEDYDYSFRARLAGIPVHYALKSWLVHFYGKSSWSGVEDQKQRAEREEKMIATFEKKWGRLLKDLAFGENEKIISENGLQMPQTVEDYTNLIRVLKERG